jgi:hypothetical protein
MSQPSRLIVSNKAIQMAMDEDARADQEAEDDLKRDQERERVRETKKNNAFITMFMDRQASEKQRNYSNDKREHTMTEEIARRFSEMELVIKEQANVIEKHNLEVKKQAKLLNSHNIPFLENQKDRATQVRLFLKTYITEKGGDRILSGHLTSDIVSFCIDRKVSCSKNQAARTLTKLGYTQQPKNGKRYYENMASSYE